jgi:thiamine-phosphate pyrophosphorylase
LVITDDSAKPEDELVACISAAVAGGADGIQYREKRASVPRTRAVLNRLAGVCREGGAQLWLNADCLEAAGEGARHATGIHYSARTWPDRLPGVPAAYSAHEIAEAEAVLAEGATFVTLSPIFPTPSKAPFLMPRGCGWLQEARAILGDDAPFIALGGIDLSNAAKAVEAGADGVAVIRAVMGATGARDAAGAIRRAVDTALAMRRAFQS